MRELKSVAGLCVVPALAFAYAAYAMWELTDGSFQRVTVIYTAVIVVPMVILGAIGLAGDLLAFRRAAGAGGEAAVAGKAEDGPTPGGTRRLVLVVGASLALVVALDWVGYLAGFLVYIPFVLWAVGMRRPMPMLAIAVTMTAIVHFVFAGLLGQDLPLGFMAGWLGD